MNHNPQPTDSMKLKEIAAHWMAKKGTLKAVNPHQRYITQYDEIGKFEGCYESPEYLRFEQSAGQHTFATDLPNGVYQVEELAEPVWQINDSEGHIIANQEDIQYSNQLLDVCQFVTRLHTVQIQAA